VRSGPSPTTSSATSIPPERNSRNACSSNSGCLRRVSEPRNSNRRLAAPSTVLGGSRTRCGSSAASSTKLPMICERTPEYRRICRAIAPLIATT
jgi:hypothetical protein